MPMSRYHPSLHRILAVFLSFLLGLVGLLALCALLDKGTTPVVRAQGPDTYSTYYVAPGADCGGETPCYASIQEAVDATDDPADVIKVAAGTYTGVHGRPRPAGYSGPAVITQVVYISRSLTLQGGYTTTDWSTPDPEGALTTIDAQEAGRVICIAGDISVTVDGFQITKGNATFLDGWQSSGNADRGSGGGIYVLSATVTLRNNRIFENSAYGTDPSDSFGGGIFATHTDALIERNDIVSNTSPMGGGGLSMYGSNAQVNQNTIQYNQAVNGWGGGLSLWECTSTLDGNVIAHNGAGGGGGISLYQSRAILESNAVLSNSGGSGGGIALNWLWPGTVLSNTVIAGNWTEGQYGSLHLWGTRAHLLHTTVACNRGPSGIGIYAMEGPYSEPSRVYMTNTILVSHTIGIQVDRGSFADNPNSANMEGTLWGAGAWANETDWVYGIDWNGRSILITGTPALNFWGDPAFVQPDALDYRIRADSAAIDRGVDAGVTQDIEGDARPAGNGYDLGADEYVEWPRIYLPIVLRNDPE